MNLLHELADIFGEEISAADATMIRSGLGKFSLSGIYRLEETHDLVDVMLLRFKLQELGPLNDLELNYRFKLSDIDKENVVKAPSNYEEWTNPLEENWPEEEVWEEESELEETGL